MFEWFDTLTTLQIAFVIMAGVAGLFFVIQVVAMMVGGLGDADLDMESPDLDADMDLDADADVDAHDVAAHADSSADFHWISIQGITAFFMMFGLIGLMLNKGHGWGAGASVGIGVGAGLVTNFAVAKIFQMFRRLQSSGTMDLRNAIGEEGNVYLTIKSDEPGKIQIAVQEHLKVFDAVSADGSEIPTDSRIRVVRLVKGNTMVVERVQTSKKEEE